MKLVARETPCGDWICTRSAPGEPFSDMVTIFNDTLRLLTFAVIIVTVVMLLWIMKRSADDGQRARFFGSTAWGAGICISMWSGLGNTLTYQLLFYFVGALGMAYGNADFVMRAIRADRTSGD